MSGNEALARGAYEAGVTVASAYPGTPSTEIMENFSQYEGAHAEWAVNEKVACEVAAGASIRGARAFAAMKHVGLNVAADAFMSYAYHVTNGGFVLVTADEPNMHSSQNEQDNRYFALFGKTALIEPSDSQECLDFMKEAFDISEKYETPVLFRVTTRTCHSKSIVNTGERVVPPIKKYVKDIRKNLMVPAISRARHPEIENVRLAGLQEYSNNCYLNKFEYNNNKALDKAPSIGIITSGIAYNYAKEVMGDNASYLKIGFVNPLPDKMIKEFASKVDKLYVIEENDPFIENQVRAMGINCIGKDVFPICGEYSPELLREILLGIKPSGDYNTEMQAPPRSPVLCAGCPHRGLFFELGKYRKKAYFSGDIGCYTLGAMAPLSALDSTICMGGSITGAHGFEKANVMNNESMKSFALIGDSTFFHSGITGLINTTYNNSAITTIILDNSITGMTGHQDNPGTGKRITGEIAQKIDIETLCYACGIKKENLLIVDPYDTKSTREALKKGYEATEPFVIITKRECALLKPIIKKRANMKSKVDPDKCRSCKACLKCGCPALIFEGKTRIDSDACNGCGVCVQICPFDAIEKVGE
jgi:indolepyruvate ferredoxin oxidoreductase alpha subunit